MTATPPIILHIGDLWGTRTGNCVRVEAAPDMTPRLSYTNFEPGVLSPQSINQESVDIFAGFKPVLATRGTGQQVWPIEPGHDPDDGRRAASAPTAELLGREVHAAWRDGMLRQGRDVAPDRMNWETLSDNDKRLDKYIAGRLALLIIVGGQK